MVIVERYTAEYHAWSILYYLSLVIGIITFVNIPQSHWREWRSSFAGRLNKKYWRNSYWDRWCINKILNTMVSIDAKWGCSLIFSCSLRQIRAFFWKPAPGMNSGMYFRIGITSTRNAPGAIANEKPLIAASAMSMKGSLWSFIWMPYVIDIVAPPTALISSGVNNAVSEIHEIKEPNYCLDILKNSSGFSSRRGNIFRMNSISIGR